MIVTHKISTKAIPVNADIATQDSIHPDKEVHYTYIGMGSLDEGFPLLIHFNDDIDVTTIVEPWDTFDLGKYEDRIINLNELISDIQLVKDAGVSTVRKITPSTGVDRTADTNLIEGQWAIYQGKVYVNPKYPEVTDIQLYEVSGASRKRIGQKLTKEGTMGKVGEELKEAEKVALLMKYAGNDYLRFEAGATLHAYVDGLDLTSNQAVIDIRKSELSPDDKVLHIKEVAKAAAIEKLQELADAVPGVSITYGSVDQDIDNMNWDEILIDEE